ncbi:hypothetical protein [Burkholderia sp. Ac-20344]|nr:hypothetical protein [Burkholderia sp. Ac-20344]
MTLGSAGHLRWLGRDGLPVAPKAANEEGRYDIRANSILLA